MSTLRLNRDAVLPSLNQQDRFRLRRRRTAAGPLKTLPRRRGGSWVVSFALFAAGVCAVAVTVVGLSERHADRAESPAATASPRVAATPATVAPAAAVPASVAVPQPVEAARETAAAAAPDRAEASPFALDRLPVLEADGAGFEPDHGATSPARSARTAPRRSAASAQR